MAGIIVVASTAITGVWVHPIKNKAIRAVEGRPVMVPPIFVPCLSARWVATDTQAPPIRKDKTNFKMKMLFNR